MNRKWISQLPISHRGLFNNKTIPENSIKAFQNSIDNRYAIELDVRITKDNKIVVFHDANLKRMCGVSKKVSKCTYEDLRKYKLLDTNEHIPLLNDVLKLTEDKVGLLVEIKCGLGYVKISKHVHQILKKYKGDYAIQSFSPFCVKWFERHAPEITRGQLATKSDIYFPTSKFFEKLRFFNYNKPDFISYGINYLPNKYIDKILKENKSCLLIAWTIKNDEQKQKAQKHCDNYIFDHIRP